MKKMTSKELAAYNASYFGIPVKWMPIHNRYMSIPTNQWPQSLVDFAQEVSKRVGWCGDVAACAVADWIKQEKNAGRLPRRRIKRAV